MKCPQCNYDFNEAKLLYVPELGIEVEVDVHHKNVCLSKIPVPSGFRLLTFAEVIFLANSKYAPQLKMDLSSYYDDFFFEQPFECNRKQGYLAGFYANSNRAFLDCGGGPQDSDSALGVRFCRDLKKKVKK